MHVIERLPLETERLLLRRYTLADAAAIYRINSTEEVTRYLPFGPMMSEGDAISQLGCFFLPAYAQADAGQTGPGSLPLDLKFAACLKDTKELVVDLARSLGITRLTATGDVRNAASERVLVHIGMKPRRPAEGSWRGGEKNGCRLWELELRP